MFLFIRYSIYVYLLMINRIIQKSNNYISFITDCCKEWSLLYVPKLQQNVRTLKELAVALHY